MKYLDSKNTGGRPAGLLISMRMNLSKIRNMISNISTRLKVSIKLVISVNALYHLKTHECETYFSNVKMKGKL